MVTDISKQKTKQNFNPYHIKHKMQRIMEIHVRAKSIKLLEENIKKIMTLVEDSISQIGFKNHNFKVKK